MKLTIYTVANYDYFHFVKVFISSIRDNFPNEKLNKIVVNDLGLSDKQRIELRKCHRKLEYIKTKEEGIRVEGSHTEPWRNVINEKTVGLERLCKEENYPILMIDSDMYATKDFSDEIFYGCDIQVCKQDPEIINYEGHLIDHIGCWFVVHNDKGKQFIKSWRDRIPSMRGSHVETPALCESIRQSKLYGPKNEYSIKVNDINKVASMDYESDPKVVHFRTNPKFPNHKESFEDRIDNVANFPDVIKNKIRRSWKGLDRSKQPKNNTAVLIDEFLEKHSENLDLINNNFQQTHKEIYKLDEEKGQDNKDWKDGSTGAVDCKYLQLLCIEKKPKKILEIGTWVGSTAYAMAFATLDLGTEIYSCDNQNAFYYSPLECATRITVFPDIWSTNFLYLGLNDKWGKNADFIFNDASISEEDCSIIYELASDKFSFVTHDYYNGDGGKEKGAEVIEYMVQAIIDKGGTYELFKPEKEWYYSGYKKNINGCCALLECNKKTKI